MKSNLLKYTVTKYTKQGGRLKITVKLGDECKNGHQDFSVTADEYENGRLVACDCMHEEILRLAPEFQPFVDLHLTDYNGIPMYAVENGFYHLNKMTKEEFSACYRISFADWETLRIKAANEGIYAFLLRELGILDKWKAEGQAGIKALEKLTGQEFLNDSVKDNFSRFSYIQEGVK